MNSSFINSLLQRVIFPIQLCIQLLAVGDELFVDSLDTSVILNRLLHTLSIKRSADDKAVVFRSIEQYCA